jgi:hypothetical protein
LLAKLASTAEIIPFKHLVHTKDMKEIRIKYPFDKRLSNRCPHRDHPSLIFAKMVLQIGPGEEKLLFPSLDTLDTLSLSAVSFQFAAREMACALNVIELNSLKLWNCSQSLGFLDTIVSEGRTPRLRSFELVIDLDHDEAEIHADPTTGFLKAFKELKDLFLMFTEPTNWNSVVPGILAHKSTLKRLMVHGRSPDHLGRPDDEEIPTSTIEQLFGEIRLSCFGICVGALRLVRSLLFP